MIEWGSHKFSSSDKIQVPKNFTLINLKRKSRSELRAVHFIENNDDFDLIDKIAIRSERKSSFDISFQQEFVISLFDLYSLHKIEGEVSFFFVYFKEVLLKIIQCI